MRERLPVPATSTEYHNATTRMLLDSEGSSVSLTQSATDIPDKENKSKVGRVNEWIVVKWIRGPEE